MKKLKSQKGLTLVEMLASVVTLLILAAICTTGLGLATKSHNESTFWSESQYLEDTLNTAVSDILRYAWDIETDADGNVTVFSNDNYSVKDASLTLDNGASGMMQLSAGADEYLLLGKNTYAKTLYLSDFTLKYDSGIFSGEYKIKSTILDDTERVCTFKFRTLAEILPADDTL